MDGHRHHEPVTDASLDREIASMLAVDPSPEFLARVRTRVVDEAIPVRWRIRWDLAAAAIVVVVIAAFGVWRSQSEPGSDRVRVSDPVAVKPPGGSPPTESSSPIVRSTTPSANRPLTPLVSDVRTSSPIPEARPPIPVVAADDGRAFDRLLATIRDQDVVLVFNDTSPESALSASTLAIAPIAIEPLAITLEGDVE